MFFFLLIILIMNLNLFSVLKEIKYNKLKMINLKSDEKKRNKNETKCNTLIDSIVHNN